MRKILCAVLALSLLFSLSCSALAEGVLTPLVESAQTLLFDTINVTLSGKAVFSLDGERFKTAEILYKQSGEDSLWQLDLRTPRLYRGDQETGFTIIANGEKIYVMERYYPGTYTQGTDQPNSTLIRQSTRADLLFSMLLSVADHAETLLPEDAVTVSETASGREYRFSLSADTAPAVVNSSLNLLADFILRRFMGVNYDSVRGCGQGLLENYTTVTQGILYSTDSFVLGDTSVTVAEDAGGRVTSVSGTVTALLNSEEMSGMPLEITFDLAVSDYGATSVETFDPKAFGVVPRGDELPSRETEPELAEKTEARAKELLSVAGYDTDSLPSSTLVNEMDGIWYVNFIGDGVDRTITAGLNENGDLLILTDASEEYGSASPREPKDYLLPRETTDALDAFLAEAFPALAETVQEYVLGLEYVEDSVTWQYIYALDEHREHTGIVFIVRTDPAPRIVYFTCLNR